MRTAQRVVTVVLVLLAAFASASSALALPYTITSLDGVLPGYPGTPSYGPRFAINNSGQIAGKSGGDRAFLYTPGQGTTDICQCIYFVGISSDGRVVGSGGNGGYEDTFVYTPGVGLQYIRVGNIYSDAFAVNSSGQIVGEALDVYQYPGDPPEYTSYSFIYNPGQGASRFPDYARAESVQPHDINDLGWVVGGSWGYAGTGGGAFLYKPGQSLTYLGLSGGAVSSEAWAISNTGYVAGNLLFADGSRHAFLHSAGSGIVDLGVLDGVVSNAEDVNNLGQVVGSYALSDRRSRGFAYIPGQGMTSLEAYGYDAHALGINDSGQIVGYYKTSDGLCHPVLWTLTPEPSSLLALGAGLVSMAGLICRRSR